MKKVSFDFDGTLSRKDVQKYAQFLIKNNIEVYITTSRFEPGFKHTWGAIEYNNDDIFNIASKLNINKKNITFTNMTDKYIYLNDDDIIWHLDDERFEIVCINKKTDTNGILITDDWKNKCNNFLFNK